MIHVKNLRSTAVLDGKSPYEVDNNEVPTLDHLRVLRSTVYVFIHEEERQRKSAKFAPRAQKGMLVGNDEHTIYRVFLEESNKIIRLKNSRIHEDAVAKSDTIIPTYEAIMIDDIVIIGKIFKVNAPKRRKGRPKKEKMLLTEGMADLDVEDSIILLIKSILRTNVINLETFVLMNQSDVIEPSTYNAAMNEAHSTV